MLEQGLLQVLQGINDRPVRNVRISGMRLVGRRCGMQDIVLSTSQLRCLVHLHCYATLNGMVHIKPRRARDLQRAVTTDKANSRGIEAYTADRLKHEGSAW
jgi:hypothetical protein